MHRVLPLILLLAAMPLAADPESEIRSALDYDAEVWNEDDIDAIEGYYHPDFVLVTEKGVINRARQLEGIRNLVRDGGDRGELSYSQVTIEGLGEKHAMAYGRVALKFRDGSELESWFTTVYVKTPFGWKALLTRN
jgi:ketosteroid isomerase-like protein